MAVKQSSNSQTAPDGSQYVTVTDGVGNLLPNPGDSALNNLNVGQITIGTTSTQIVPSRSNRNAVTIINLGTTDIFLGNSGVTTTTGALLPGIKGSSLTIPVVGAIHGVVATGTQAVSILETY